MALLKLAICCGDRGASVFAALTEAGWKHVAREAGVGFVAYPHHLWWLSTKHHALGVIVIDDCDGTPLVIWKVRRKADGLEVEGMGGESVITAANRAVDALTEWLAADARRSKAKALKFTAALTEEVPF